MPDIDGAGGRRLLNPLAQSRQHRAWWAFPQPMFQQSRGSQPHQERCTLLRAARHQSAPQLDSPDRNTHYHEGADVGHWP